MVRGGCPVLPGQVGLRDGRAAGQVLLDFTPPIRPTARERMMDTPRRFRAHVEVTLFALGVMALVFVAGRKQVQLI